MGLIELARAATERHGISLLLAEKTRLLAELTATERRLAEIEQRISWFDRAAFFHQTTDERQAHGLAQQQSDLGAQLTALDVRLNEALKAAVAEVPPLGVASTVLSVVDAGRRLLFRNGVGSRLIRAERAALMATLQQLSAHVLETWTPGFDPEAAMVLLDDRSWARHARSASHLPRNHAPGFAAISSNEALTRAISALDTDEFRRARAIMSRESFDLAQANEALARVKQALRSARGRAGAPLEAQAIARVNAERLEVLGASEELAHLVEGALATFPPLGVYLAAQTCSEMFDQLRRPMEQALHLDGVVRPIQSFVYSALALDSLAELKRATELAFPGVISLILGGDVAQQKARSNRPASPFRVAALTEPSAALAEDSVAKLMQLYEAAGVRDRVRRARFHARASAAAGRARQQARARVTARDRLAIWADSRAEIETGAMEARAAWHRAALMTIAAQLSATILPLSARFHALRVRDHILKIHYAILNITTLVGEIRPGLGCPTFNREPALAEVNALAQELASNWGLSGTGEQLARAVLLRIQAGGPFISSPERPAVLPFDDVIGLLADALRTTELSPAMLRLGGYLEVTPQNALSPDRTLVWTLLRQATNRYPPARLYFSLSDVATAIQSMSAVLRRHRSKHRTWYTCELLGFGNAMAILQAWTRDAFAVLGEMPPDGLLLCHFVDQHEAR